MTVEELQQKLKQLQESIDNLYELITKLEKRFEDETTWNKL